MKFYHKYLVTENGVSREGDWEEVTEQVFDANGHRVASGTATSEVEAKALGEKKTDELSRSD